MLGVKKDQRIYKQRLDECQVWTLRSRTGQQLRMGLETGGELPESRLAKRVVLTGNASDKNVPKSTGRLLISDGSSEG